MAKRGAGVGEAVGILAGGRVEKNASGFESLRAEDDRLAANFLDLAGGAIDVGDAAGSVGGVVHVDVADNGIGDESAVSGLESVFDGGERAAEIREGGAAAFAGAAVMACGASVVNLSENSGATDGDGVAESGFDPFTHQNFAATHFHRRGG